MTPATYDRTTAYGLYPPTQNLTIIVPTLIRRIYGQYPMPPELLIPIAAALVLVLFVVVVVLRRRAKATSAQDRAGSETVPFFQTPSAFLERVGEGGGPRIFALNKPYMIVGRDESSDIVLNAKLPNASTVSRRHAQIRREDDDFVVEDLGSQNGIKVNGHVTHRNLLHDGDHLSFGSVEFTFRLPHSPQSSESDT